MSKKNYLKPRKMSVNKGSHEKIVKFGKTQLVTVKLPINFKLYTSRDI